MRKSNAFAGTVFAEFQLKAMQGDKARCARELLEIYPQLLIVSMLQASF